MTFKEAEEQIKKLDKSLEPDNNAFKVAALMVYGTKEAVFTVNELTKVSGYPKKIVADTVRLLKEEGIWRNGKVYHSGWFDKDSGGINFWVDVNRGLGFITCK